MKPLLICVLLCAAALSQDAPRPLRPVHTFSIVARDPVTGELGAAVQSHWFAVGGGVIWAEPGVGAVATQSFIDPSYGPKGLNLMRNGTAAPDALRALLVADSGRDVRQVAFIDAQGRAGTFTGEKDIPAAGGVAGNAQPAPEKGDRNNPPGTGRLHMLIGRDFAVQANLMSNDQVWPAMDKAFRETKGDLAERMLAALDAAQAAGGDIRGRQSAALIVVSGDRAKHPWEKTFDLRVDDAPQPLAELRRLVALQRAYNHMNAGDAAVEHKDNEAALREYSAAEQIALRTEGVPQSRLAEMMYWHAVALVTMGRVDESLPLFRKVFSMEKNWVTLTRRLPKVGLLPDDPKITERIVQEAGR
jgi:uncharacterized Ntn-hydrolase superfamily protein